MAIKLSTPVRPATERFGCWPGIREVFELLFESQPKRALKRSTSVDTRVSKMHGIEVHTLRQGVVFQPLSRKKTHFYRSMFQGLLQIFYDLLQFSCPMLLNLLVTHLSNRESLQKGWHYASLLAACSLVLAFSNVHINYLMDKIRIQTRTAILSIIHHKACFVKTNQCNNQSSSTTLGNISSFLSADIETILYAFSCIHLAWSKPIQVVVAFYLLYAQIGPACLVGLLVVVALIPLNRVLSHRVGIAHENLMKHKDKRVKVS